MKISPNWRSYGKESLKSYRRETTQQEFAANSGKSVTSSRKPIIMVFFFGISLDGFNQIVRIEMILQ